MCDELKAALIKNAEKSKAADKPDDAMKYAQAALNLAHAIATLKGADR